MQNSEESTRTTLPSASSCAQPSGIGVLMLESRFIESEADLDAALKQFLPLTQNPPLYYPELVKTGAIALLANLLSHENTDIAIDVIEIIQELTDEDVGADVDDMAEDEAEGSSGGMATRTRMAMGELIDDLVSLKALMLGVKLIGTAK